MCVNLKNKKYCIKNVEYSQQEYDKKLASIQQGKYQDTTSLLQHFLDFVREHPHRSHHNLQCEVCVGDFITNSKNVVFSNLISDSEDVRHSYLNIELKDSIDAYES